MFCNNVTTLQIAEWWCIQSGPIIDNFCLLPMRLSILDISRNIPFYLKYHIKRFLLVQPEQNLCILFRKGISLSSTPSTGKILFIIFPAWVVQLCRGGGSPLTSYDSIVDLRALAGGCRGDLRCLSSPESTNRIRKIRSSSCGPFKESHSV